MFLALGGGFLTTEPLGKSQHLHYSLPSQTSRPFRPSVDGLISYPIEKAACSPTYQNLSHICSLAFLTEKRQHFLLLFCVCVWDLNSLTSDGIRGPCSRRFLTTGPPGNSQVQLFLKVTGHPTPVTSWMAFFLFIALCFVWMWADGFFS